MSFPIPKSAMSKTALFFFDNATNTASDTVNRFSLAQRLEEADAAAKEYVITWSHVLQVGWTCELYVEPVDLGKPTFVKAEYGISFNPNLMREDAQRIIVAELIFSLMSAETWRIQNGSD